MGRSPPGHGPRAAALWRARSHPSTTARSSPPRHHPNRSSPVRRWSGGASRHGRIRPHGGQISPPRCDRRRPLPPARTVDAYSTAPAGQATHPRSAADSRPARRTPPGDHMRPPRTQVRRISADAVSVRPPNRGSAGRRPTAVPPAGRACGPTTWEGPASGGRGSAPGPRPLRDARPGSATHCAPEATRPRQGWEGRSSGRALHLPSPGAARTSEACATGCRHRHEWKRAVRASQLCACSCWAPHLSLQRSSASLLVTPGGMLGCSRQSTKEVPHVSRVRRPSGGGYRSASAPSVLVRMTETGERLDAVRIDNDPMTLASEIAKSGEHPTPSPRRSGGLVVG
jgi:hypothetical protein